MAVQILETLIEWYNNTRCRWIYVFNVLKLFSSVKDFTWNVKGKFWMQMAEHSV